MRKEDRPIGVFDSGVGGLTVFRALRKRLPRETLLYFGDTAHLPYGSKSPEAVRSFALQIARFLVRQRIKLLVVACNTASAVALDALREAVSVPVLGVIEPGASAAARATRTGRIGVIGTEATVGSRAYEEALRRIRPGVRVVSAACPVLVPIVEEGWWGDGLAEAALRKYLKPLKGIGLDTLILGCTHYPLLKPAIKKIMGPKVKLVDSGEETAAAVETLLAADRMLARTARPGHRFYASDAPDRFERLAKRLLGMAVEKVEIRRFE